MMIDVTKKMKFIKSLVKLLSAQDPIYFKDLKPSDMPNNTAGVYIIFDKGADAVLYVGRTKNLRTRLYRNHLNGRIESARLKHYLMKDESRDKIKTEDDAREFLINNCCFKYITEDDTIERGKLEGLLSFVFDVKYMYEEH